MGLVPHRDLRKREYMRAIDLGAEQLLVLELRPA
jgi:hypothetical protein